MKPRLLLYFMTVASLSVSARNFDITEYGAVSDTTCLSTMALQNAIDACSNSGGGRVVVPTGNYKIGSIRLKSNVHLYLEEGATLYGSTDIKDYVPFTSSYISLRTGIPTIQLIYADSVENVSISGFGTIDGRGKAFPKLSWDDAVLTRSQLLLIIRGKDITVGCITLKNSGC